MFEYDFMRNAFAAGGCVAIVAGVSGFFLVLRGQTFAGHALSHVGFAGATGAVLFGFSPIGGLLSATVFAGIGMGLFGDRMAGRDVAIGMVLSIALGFGMLFLHFYTSYAAQATALLFGNILGVGATTLWTLAALALASLMAITALARPLIFVSLQPELAEAKGISVRLTSVGFLMIVAIVTAACVQIVGVLLVFTLMVGPAATALRLTNRLIPAIALSGLLALCYTWFGIVLAYYSDWPTSFWITALSGFTYLITIMSQRIMRPLAMMES